MKNFDNIILDYELTLPNGDMLAHDKYLHISYRGECAIFLITINWRDDGRLAVYFKLKKSTSRNSMIRYIESCNSLHAINSEIHTCEYKVTDSIDDNPFNAEYPETRQNHSITFDTRDILELYSTRSIDNDIRTFVIDYVDTLRGYR